MLHEFVFFVTPQKKKKNITRVKRHTSSFQTTIEDIFPQECFFEDHGAIL